MTIVDFILEIKRQHQPEKGGDKYYLAVYWHHNWNNQDSWISGATFYIPQFEKDLQMFEWGWRTNNYTCHGNLRLYRIVTEFKLLGKYYVEGTEL